ncbi:MAG: PEP-CTERM sorting domain-containing protein [Pseudomonadota bacterium]
MKKFKKVLAGVAVAAALATSQAATINVGGVVWDPNSSFDFSGTTATITQTINAVTGELSGFGNITTLNNTLQNTFCPGCELTVQYSGFLPTVASAIPGVGGAGQVIQYTGGTLTLFVDNTPDTNGGTTLTFANTGDGLVWLSLAGHPDAGGITLTGTNFFPTSLAGAGLLDVIGGLAAANTNTNTKTAGADFTYSTTFTNFPNGNPLFATGSGTFNGASIAITVPEPESLALFGVALLGLVASRRRKSV